MFAKDIGIDLGTTNILIYVKGQGIVLNEPSVITVGENKRVIAVGNDAKEMLGKTPGNYKAVRPLKDGVIADFELTEIMLEHFIKKINARGVFNKPKILICCPTNITQVEKNAIKETVEKLGAKKGFIELEPKVAAIGAGIDIAKPTGNMVIDIGGGTTDIAVLSLGNIVVSTSLKIAGNTFDEDIVKYIKEKYKLLIGEKTAEEIKLTIGTIHSKGFNEKMRIKGRDLITGLPNTITITSEEIEEALKHDISIIIRSIKNTLEITPPELAADIVDKGIVLTGGGAMLNGLDKVLKRELKVPIKIAESPLTCVVEGTGILLDNLYLIEK